MGLAWKVSTTACETLPRSTNGALNSANFKSVRCCHWSEEVMFGGRPFYSQWSSGPSRVLPREDENTRRMREFYRKVAGEDMEMDWAELKRLLDMALKREFNFDGFSKEVCRSMVALMDTDKSGKLGIEEFTKLWGLIRTWKESFWRFDSDRSGKLNGYELKQALASAGYHVSDRVLRSLVLRYGDHRGQISFDDFVMCAVKMKAMIDIFLERDYRGVNRAKFTMDEWIETSLYC